MNHPVKRVKQTVLRQRIQAMTGLNREDIAMAIEAVMDAIAIQLLSGKDFELKHVGILRIIRQPRPDCFPWRVVFRMSKPFRVKFQAALTSTQYQGPTAALRKARPIPTHALLALRQRRLRIRNPA